ncbi:hypothetical protein BKA62DRAFT_62967 [Auriculariales sp. MPI-PUGE-AT-0066]|nr:hypothetical protein BKA62DRAFT_62967 [Auriculariales sp. MPI-PUGE-AT-0066]
MQLHPPTRPRSPRMYGSYAPPPHPPPATQPEEPTFSLSVYAEFEATGPEKKLVREIFSLTMGTSNPAELDDPSAILLGDLAVPLFETTGLPMLVLGEVWNVADEVCGGFLTRNGVALALRMMGWAQFDMDEGKPFAVDVGDVVRLEWLRPDGPMPHLDALSDRPNPHRKEPKFLPSKRPPAQPEYVRVHSHTPPPIPSPTLRSATPVTKTAAVALGHAAFPHGHHHEQSGSSISTPLASSSTIPSNSFTHKQPVDTFDTISDALIGLSFDWKPAPRRADSNSTTNATSPSSRFSMLSTSLEKGKWKPLELRTDQVESADPFADPGAASSSAVKLRAVSSSSSTIEPISQHSSALPESYSTPLAAQPAPVAVPKFDVSPPPRSSSTEDDDIRAARAKYPGLVPSPVPFSRGPAIPEGSRLSDDKLKLMYPELPSRPTSTSPPVISPISNVVVPTPNLMAPEVAPTAESSLPLITAVQRTKYLGLWRNAGGKGENDDERLDGDSCRAVFMKSRLGFGLLGRVWCVVW